MHTNGSRLIHGCPPRRTRGSLLTDGLMDGITSAAWAEKQTAAVRDDPAARIALVERSYRGPFGQAPRHLPFPACGDVVHALAAATWGAGAAAEQPARARRRAGLAGRRVAARPGRVTVSRRRSGTPRVSLSRGPVTAAGGQPARFLWDCPTCGQTIADHGPGSSPASSEQGHAEGYQRLAADTTEWQHRQEGR
jgi:hypothetical protein